MYIKFFKNKKKLILTDYFGILKMYVTVKSRRLINPRFYQCKLEKIQNNACKHITSNFHRLTMVNAKIYWKT